MVTVLGFGVCSYWPPGNDANDAAWLELKDDLQLPSAKCPAKQLVTISILLVPANLKVQEETLNSLIERHAVLRELVLLEVVLEIGGSKPMPIDHGSFYRAPAISKILCRPNAPVQRRRGAPSAAARCWAAARPTLPTYARSGSNGTRRRPAGSA